MDVERSPLQEGPSKQFEGGPRKPSLLVLLASSYAAVIFFLFPLIGWVMFAGWSIWPDKRDRHDSAQFFLWWAIGVSVVCLPLLGWKIHVFRSVLRAGVPVKGRFTGFWNWARGWRGITYEYQYEGRAFRSWGASNRADLTDAFQPGQEITVLVHPRRPARSIVPSLFG
jgi:hypothetical protein